jgi:hypothetical protein
VHALHIAIFIPADLEFDAGKSPGNIARDFVCELFVRVGQPTATPVHWNGLGVLAEEYGGRNAQSAREQIPERYIDRGSSPHRDTFLPDVFRGGEVSFVDGPNGVGRLAKNVSLQFFLDDGFQKRGSVIEGEHVAGAYMISRTNLNQDQINEA